MTYAIRASIPKEHLTSSDIRRATLDINCEAYTLVEVGEDGYRRTNDTRIEFIWIPAHGRAAFCQAGEAQWTDAETIDDALCAFSNLTESR